MMIIGESKKRRIALRLGFLWFWMKSLSPADFDMATEVLCNLCYDLDVKWEVVQRAAKVMEEAVAHRKATKERGEEDGKE